MKKPQWITAGAGAALVLILFFFGRTVPDKKPGEQAATQTASATLSIDTILFHAKERITPNQLVFVNGLEKSVVRGDVKAQQLNAFHQLAHFWEDSARIFEPYAWYEAEAARLENSEKSLTFAAHLFLDNLRSEENLGLKQWKALQAKDLFERSLKINPANDSSTVGLGACYIFGNIAENPMEGIMKVRSVAEKDSTNIYAQTVLGYGSLISGQTDKAITRFETIARMKPNNLEAIMILADLFERKQQKQTAIEWYTKSLPLIPNPQMRGEVEARIAELKK